MNQKILTEQIIYHVLSNLGVLSSFSDSMQKIINKQFLLSDKLSFETEDGIKINGLIFGCQIATSDGKQLKILVGDCTQNKLFPEYCLLIHLQDSPAYGAYLIFDDTLKKPDLCSEALIAFTINNKTWTPCNTYLEATFLAGMERLRDLNLGWKICHSYEDQYKMLISFLEFHTSIYGSNNEG